MDTNNYGFGGPSNAVNVGYNIWSQNRICGATNISKLSRGDHIEVILDLSKKALIFVINSDKHYVLNGINTNTNSGYKLALHLLGASITLVDFVIYNTSYYNIVGSSIDMENAITYSI